MGARGAEQSLDPVNRDSWQDPDVVADVDRLTGWSDPGEAAALGVVAAAARGRPVLDVGIGTGRTVALLRLLTDGYVGVDYSPGMLAEARARHPDRDLRLGDARDLSAFADGAFALAVFSLNGLDAVDHDGRARALGELARVTAPGGHVVYSTHNKLGPSWRETPWHRFGRPDAGRPRWLRAVKTAVLLPRRVGELRRTYTAWLRQRPHSRDHGDWGLSALAVHGYRFRVHFTTLDAALAEAAAAGLEPLVVFGNDGRSYAADADTAAVDYFHVVARRAGR